MSLPLPCNEAKTVEIYSNNTKQVYLPGKNFDNRHKLFPNIISYIAIHTKTFSAENKRVIVNAIGKYNSIILLIIYILLIIEADTGKLIYAWLIIMASLPPSPSKTMDCDSLAGAATVIPVPFKNESLTEKIFEVSTSRPDLMIPEQGMEQIRIARDSTYMINMRILPQSQHGIGECFVFINDMDCTVSECICCNINFKMR